MKLFVKVEFTKRTIRLELNPGERTYDFEERIKEHEGIPNHHVCALFFEGNEVPLRNHEYLHSLEDGAILYFKNKSFEIYVETSSGDIISLQVKSSDSIGMIKDKVQEMSGVPSSSFDLCTDLIPNEDLDLRQVEIRKNSNLHMALNLSNNSLDILNIFVSTLTGKTIKISRVRDSVLHLKLMIRALEGIPVLQQILIFAGRQLENVRRLSDYGCENGCKIHITLNLCGD